MGSTELKVWTKEDSERESRKVIDAGGRRLYELLPMLFSNKAVIDSYKAEHDRIKDSMFRRYWQDNGPVALRRAMHHHNLVHKFCVCTACRNESLEIIPCVFWAKFVDFTRSADLTICVTHPTLETHPEIVVPAMKNRRVLFR